MAKKLRVIDRQTAIALGEEFEAAVQKIAKKHGLSIQLKSRKFGSGSFSAKLEAAVVSQGGVAETKEARAYAQLAGMKGFKKNLGDTFTSRGVAYIVTGYNTRAHRMPIQAKRVGDGAGFKFTESVVK